MYRMTVQKYTIICSDDPYCHSRRGRAQRIRGRPHSEPFFFIISKALRFLFGCASGVSRATVLISAFRAKITVRRAVFSSDLTFLSENEPWLLVFMALGENLKISIFAPPGGRPA